MCAKFHRATFSTLGDIPGTLNLESGRETGRGSGRKFVRDLHLIIVLRDDYDVLLNVL
jgi:hypothetical protein